MHGLQGHRQVKGQTVERDHLRQMPLLRWHGTHHCESEYLMAEAIRELAFFVGVVSLFVAALLMWGGHG